MILLHNAVYISDLHVDKDPEWRSKLVPDTNRTLIVAGDVGRVEHTTLYISSLEWLCQNFEHVILIPGNHEYYTSSPNLTIQSINLLLDGIESKFVNLTIIKNDWFVGYDYIFYGGTLWSQVTEETYFQTPIYMGDHLITVDEWNRLHHESLNKLDEAIKIANQLNRKLIVATHYAPTYCNTLSQKYHNHHNNAMYCSNLDHYLQNQVIAAWIYGHTGFNGRYQKLTTNQLRAKDYNSNMSLQQLLYNQQCNIHPTEEIQNLTR
jgi:predicted phosphohydrolase